MKVNSATIKAISAVASKDKTREIIAATHLDPTNGNATATDSYRLIIARAIESESGTEKPILLPPAAVKQLPHDKKQPNATQVQQSGDNYASVQNVFTDTNMTVPLTVGSYPNAARLFTDNARSDQMTATISVNARMLAEVLTALDKIGAQEVTIAVTEPTRPLIIVPAASSSTEAAALLMPTRPNGKVADTFDVSQAIQNLVGTRCE